MTCFYISVFDLQNRTILDRQECLSLDAALEIASTYVKPKTKHVAVPYKAEIREGSIEALTFWLGGSVDQSKPPSEWWDMHVESTANAIMIESRAIAEEAWREEYFEGNNPKPLGGAA